MYKNIMLALDDSKISDAIVDETIKLVKGRNVHIKIIHVIDEHFVSYAGPALYYPSIIAAYKENGEKIINNAAKKIASHSSIKPEALILELKPTQGRIAELIVEAATEWPAELLVIGTHGRHGFSRFFLGSVAENVIRIATMPVLLVRPTDI